MMGMSGEIKFGYDIPETKEGIIEKLKALQSYKPINWLSAMARQAELETLKKKLEELP